MMMKQFLLAGALLFSALAHAQRIEIGWPTPNPAYFEGRPITDFIQSTASGEIESGLFGCRRSGGAQFHEALDLKPVKRDRHGEPTDPVFSVMNGVVRYIGRIPGNSSYGRYIVLEHMDVEPAIYTLYAHLAAIAPGLSIGAMVTRGQELGTMGRSSSTQAIPRDRAHLHFEMGVMLSREFQSWYDWKKFGSHNQQGLWNGMNLMGFDPLDFFNDFRARRVDTFRDYFAHMQTAVRLQIATRRTPDYVMRYPSLLVKPLPADGLIGGWEIRVNEMGLPFSLTPLTPMETIAMATDEVRVVEANETLLKQHRCKSLVFSKRNTWAIGHDLQEVLQLVFRTR
jgi:murein DD-endopeptidase MepM/ murein hydrolase activator NlpD